MINLLWFVLCAGGLTQILTTAKVFEKIRPKHYFFHCPMCMGFWVGMFLWFVNPYTQLFNFDNGYATAFLLGCVSSLTSYIFVMTFDDEGIKIANKWRK